MAMIKNVLLKAHIDTERQRLVRRMEKMGEDGEYACPVCGNFRLEEMKKELKAYETALAFLNGEDVARIDLVQAHRMLYKHRQTMVRMRKRVDEELGTEYRESTRVKAFRQVENKIARYLDEEGKR